MKKLIINILSGIIVITLLAVFIVTFNKIKKQQNSQATLPLPTENFLQTQPPELTPSPAAPNESESPVSSDDAAPSEKPTTPPAGQDPFVNAPAGYFEDALFIGDSRTVGLSEYGNIEGATFFATTGMSVYNITTEKVSVPGMGKPTFDTLMTSKKYGKIYVMLGINELGYKMSATVKKYGELIEKIKSYQPQAILFIEANLHVSQSRSDSDPVFNNTNINTLNQEISQFADQKTVFYIDVNPLFDDENGNLAAKYTADNSHILGKYYSNWREWLCTKAVVL